MKTNPFFWSSVVFNCGLLLIIAWLVSTDRYEPELTPQRATINQSGREAAVVSAPLNPTVRPFHWSQVESEDDSQYTVNLRSIGCPEEVIKSIIAAKHDKNSSPTSAAIASTVGYSPVSGVKTKRNSQMNPSALNNESIVVKPTKPATRTTQITPASYASQATFKEASLSQETIEEINHLQNRSTISAQTQTPILLATLNRINQPPPSESSSVVNGSAALKQEPRTISNTAENKTALPASQEKSKENTKANISSDLPGNHAPYVPFVQVQEKRTMLFNVEQQQQRSMIGWDKFYYEPDTD